MLCIDKVAGGWSYRRGLNMETLQMHVWKGKMIFVFKSSLNFVPERSNAQNSIGLDRFVDINVLMC